MEADPITQPQRMWARDRRVRATHHRMVVSRSVRAKVAMRLEAQVDALHEQGPDVDKEDPWSLEGLACVASELAARRGRRRELMRMMARRDRMVALVRGVREPGRHGALRKAILNLDAGILELRRSLEPDA